MKMIHSLKLKITLFCLTMCVVFISIVSAELYFRMKDYLSKELTQRVLNDLTIINSTVNENMNSFYKLIYFCSTNQDINNYLKGTVRTTYTSYPNSLAAHSQLESRLANTSLEPYLSKIIVSSFRNDVLLSGNRFGSFDDARRCRELPYFDKLYSAPEFLWLGLMPEPFSTSAGQHTLPVIRPLCDPGSGTPIGWIYLALDPGIVSDKLTNSTLESNFYWIINNIVYQYSKSGFECTDYTVSLVANYPEYSLVEINTSSQVQQAVLVNTPDTPWQFVETIPDINFAFDKRAFFGVIAPCLILLLFSFFLFMVALHFMVSKPIAKICSHLTRLSTGDFVTDSTLERNDEFGYIGRRINHMSHNITTLMNRQVQTEEEKRQLELASLQNQISPHFLFNTLASIRIIAIMQNVPSIVKMLEALTQILKNISKNTQSSIPLREELLLLDNYILIQRYRYGDSFSYDYLIEQEELLDVNIFKFSLQPIIENAISYGVGTRNTQGQIHLHAYRKNHNLVIEILDNGNGIPQETIGMILGSTLKEDPSGFKKIGLKNINRRLILEYGADYALKIESEVSVYTKVTILYPIPQKESIMFSKGKDDLNV